MQTAGAALRTAALAMPQHQAGRPPNHHTTQQQQQHAAAPKKLQLHQQQQQDASPSAPPLPGSCIVVEEEPAICRLCWQPAEDADDPLLSPCACSGSLAWIHEGCLRDWQATLRGQGQGRRAHLCELCKQPYRLVPSSSGSSGGRGQLQRQRQRGLHRRLLQGLSRGLFDAVHHTPWPSLAVQLWHGYVMSHGAVQALRLGASGFGAGLSIGRALVEEQACLLNGLLSYTSGLVGSPYAEMLWCQAVGALFVGMLSELVYTSILGMLGGMAYGFCMGYVAAIKGSVRLVSGTSVRVLTAAGCVGARLLRRAVRVMLRV